MARKLNPNRREDFDRLRRAIEYSRKRLEGFRRQRERAIKQYVGANYSDDVFTDRVPINFLELAVGIYKRQLAANNPQVIVSTDNKQLKRPAAVFSLAINHLLNEIDFQRSVQEWVVQAMFSLGVIKVGITVDELGEIEGYLHDPGQPFSDVISLDDWVHDMTVRRYEQVQFSGNRFELPLHVAREIYGRGERGQPITSTEFGVYNEGGDPKVKNMTRGDEYVDSEGHPTAMTELWEIWLPRERVVVTIDAEDSGGPAGRDKPLRVVDWEGPEQGPFHVLNYNIVPDNTMPLSPASLLIDLHNLGNELFRKLANQSQRQKTVTVVQSGADEDGNRILNANDGDMIRVDRPEATREARYGGIDAPNMAFLLQVKDLFWTLGGNLDALGGLSPQSGTLGQDELLTAGASKRIEDMQDSTTSAVLGVVEALGDYLWYDPLIDLPLVQRVEGAPSVEIPVRFNDEIREGDFLDYNIKIVPFSMQARTPAERLRTITQVFERFVLPLAPVMQSQGIVPDMQELLRTIAKYSGVPEIEDILKFVGVPEPQQAGPGERPTQSPTTTRTNVRRNVPQETRAGRDQETVSALLQGAGSNGQR